MSKWRGSGSSGSQRRHERAGSARELTRQTSRANTRTLTHARRGSARRRTGQRASAGAVSPCRVIAYSSACRTPHAAWCIASHRIAASSDGVRYLMGAQRSALELDSADVRSFFRGSVAASSPYRLPRPQRARTGHVHRPDNFFPDSAVPAHVGGLPALVRARHEKAIPRLALPSGKSRSSAVSWLLITHILSAAPGARQVKRLGRCATPSRAAGTRRESSGGTSRLPLAGRRPRTG